MTFYFLENEYKIVYNKSKEVQLELVFLKASVFENFSDQETNECICIGIPW